MRRQVALSPQIRAQGCWCCWLKRGMRRERTGGKGQEAAAGLVATSVPKYHIPTAQNRHVLILRECTSRRGRQWQESGPKASRKYLLVHLVDQVASLREATGDPKKVKSEEKRTMQREIKKAEWKCRWAPNVENVATRGGGKKKGDVISRTVDP
jgi:hypothetical protein